MNWWRAGKRPEETAPEPEPQHRLEEQSGQPRKEDRILSLQRSVGNQAVQKLLPQSEGEPIADRERQELEAAFGRDLSEIRIHRDAEAVELAADAGANAFTTGRDVYFAAGGYSTSTLAHEVSHVIQQGEAASYSHGEEAALERQADAASSAVMSGHAAEVSSVAAAPVMQRQSAPGAQHPSLKLPKYSLTLDDFDINKPSLSASHKQQLDEFAGDLQSILSATPGTSVRILGFADAPGTEAANLTLGQQRADAVRDYLVAKGVPAYALRAHSLGEQSLLVASKGYEAKNRRVEITVVEHSFKPSEALTKRGQTPVPDPPPRPDLNVKDDPGRTIMETPEETTARHQVEEDKKTKEAKAHKEKGTSVSDNWGQKARELAKGAGLSKWMQDRAESLGKALPSKGAQTILDQIASDKGLDQTQRDALKGIIDALAKSK